MLKFLDNLLFWDCIIHSSVMMRRDIVEYLGFYRQEIALAEDAISGLYQRGKKELENIGIQVATTTEIISEIRAQYTAALVSRGKGAVPG